MLSTPKKKKTNSDCDERDGNPSGLCTGLFIPGFRFKLTIEKKSPAETPSSSRASKVKQAF